MAEDKYRTTVYLDPATAKKVKLVAKVLGVTVNAFINICIAGFLNQESNFDFLKFAKEIAKNENIDPANPGRKGD